MLRRRRRRERGPLLDLFPFLSLFLCIFGVLSFLQIVMASSGSKRVELVGEGQHGFRVPYQVFCTDDGVVPIPPVEGLRALQEVTRGADRVTVRRIRRERLARRDRLADPDTSLRERAEAMTKEERAGLLDQVAEINRIARKQRQPYEEFLLFGVYPGGGEHYRPFRQMLVSPGYRELRSGLEALDSDFRMAPIEPL